MYQKKVLVFMLVVVMLSTLLAGCIKNNSTSTKSNEKEVILTWYYPGTKQPDHEMVQNAINKKLKEKIGAEVVLQPVPFGEYVQKMNIIIASREGYDVCFTSNWLNNIYMGISKGAYLPLNDLINKHAPNIKKSLPERIFDPLTIDGKIYAIPNYQVLYTQSSINIAKDLADKYKFNVDSVPEKDGYNTLKAIEPFFEAIKKNEPNLYPVLASYYGLELTHEQINEFAIRINKKGNDNNKVYNIYETDEWQKQMELLTDWYNRGYIRKDIMSVVDQGPDQRNNKYASFFGTSKPGGVAELKTQYGKDFYQIQLEEPYIYYSSGAGTTNAISQTSKNPEKAIKLIELMNTDDELYNMICFGIEGVHYDKVSDTQITPVKDNKYAPATSWVFGNQFNAYLLPGQEPGVWEETQKNNSSAKQSPIYGFVLDTEPIKEKLSQIVSIQKEYANLYVDNGARMPEFMNKMKAAGIDDCIKEIQNQIDNWAKNKK